MNYIHNNHDHDDFVFLFLMNKMQNKIQDMIGSRIQAPNLPLSPKKTVSYGPIVNILS